MNESAKIFIRSSTYALLIQLAISMEITIWTAHAMKREIEVLSCQNQRILQELADLKKSLVNE